MIRHWLRSVPKVKWKSKKTRFALVADQHRGDTRPAGYWTPDLWTALVNHNVPAKQAKERIVISNAVILLHSAKKNCG